MARRKNLMQLVREAKAEAKRAQPLWWVGGSVHRYIGGKGYCLRVAAAADRSARPVWQGGLHLGCGYSKAHAMRAKREFESGWPRNVEVLR